MKFFKNMKQWPCGCWLEKTIDRHGCSRSASKFPEMDDEDKAIAIASALRIIEEHRKK